MKGLSWMALTPPTFTTRYSDEHHHTVGEGVGMGRYQVLRVVGCGPVTALILSALNWAMRVPPGLIVCMTVSIEYDSTCEGEV